MEHGLLLDNLLDLAHAPFTHTSTFAKGWSVPRFVIDTFKVVKILKTNNILFMSGGTFVIMMLMKQT